jgi:hypothetical protein
MVTYILSYCFLSILIELQGSKSYPKKENLHLNKKRNLSMDSKPRQATKALLVQ